jgi:phospholipid/cholesterol/gamma-HCH transport system permease protein
MANERAAAAEIHVAEPEPGRVLWTLLGEWTTPGLAALEHRVTALARPGGARLTVDGAGLAAFDTGGALLLHQVTDGLTRVGVAVEITGLTPPHERLLELVRSRAVEPEAAPPGGGDGPLTTLGRLTLGHLAEGWSMFAFVGETSIALVRSWARPGRIRWQALFGILETAGVNAVPIVSLLAFLIGVVIAYQGGVQLRGYGANIYVVELVTLTMLRELAPMMAAIIVAGRTGSAFTAQIGTMKVTEEVDALRTIGIDPVELLVLPKLFGLVIALPLLTVLADAMGVLGGMVMASSMLDVSFQEFFDRIPQAVSLRSFLVGVGKSPVFAAIIAIVGCFQGFRVQGGADSVGRQTTVSVVQAIFLVIVVDAGFSILFSWLHV